MNLDAGARTRFVLILQNIIGMPYLFGGDGTQEGFDCSGTVKYCWDNSVGKMPDMTAKDMAWRFWKDCWIERKDAQPGDLFFFGKTKREINHVMIVLRKWQNGKLILSGARGGDQNTTTEDIAYKNWALVDICSETYWGSRFQIAVNPFKKV